MEYNIPNVKINKLMKCATNCGAAGCSIFSMDYTSYLIFLIGKSRLSSFPFRDPFVLLGLINLVREYFHDNFLYVVYMYVLYKRINFTFNCCHLSSPKKKTTTS